MNRYLSSFRQHKGLGGIKRKTKKQKVVHGENLKYKKILRLVTIPVFLYAIYLACINLVPKAFKVEEISCYNQYGHCEESLIKGLKVIEGSSFKHALNEIEKVLAASMTVESSSIRYKFPLGLVVHTSEKKIIFSLYSKYNRSFALIDNKGMVVKYSDLSNLPYIIIEEKLPELADVLTSKKLFALNLVADASRIVNVYTAYIENDSLVIELTDAPDVIFPLEGDKSLLIGSLNLILTRLNAIDTKPAEKIDNWKSKVIDLRYKKPLIK